MDIIIIAAIDNNGAIGFNGNLLVRLKDDMRHFKSLTTGHTVVMGRKTFESLPKGALPDRRNIVITSNPGYSARNIIRVGSLEEAVEVAKMSGETKLFIIGGARVYADAVDMAHQLEITQLDFMSPQADTWFPEIDLNQWEMINKSEVFVENGISFMFQTFIRRK